MFLVLFWSLMEVHSQTIPYVSFMGVNLPNHAYVDLTTVGNDISATGDTVRCHTDLSTCCSGPQGVHRGDWYFPDGSVLDNAMGGGNIYKLRGAQVVHLRRKNNAMSPSGIYHCDIETVAVNDNDVDTITGETLFIGLYPPNEGIYSNNINIMSIIFSAEYIIHIRHKLCTYMKAHCNMLGHYNYITFYNH